MQQFSICLCARVLMLLVHLYHRPTRLTHWLQRHDFHHVQQVQLAVVARAISLARRPPAGSPGQVRWRPGYAVGVMSH